MTMHHHELEITVDLVTRLLAEQHPDLAHLPVRAVPSTGTVNAIFRLGDDLCVRAPRVPEWSEGIDREWRWLPWLASRITLPIPAPVRRGVATPEYPLPWSVYRWITGEPYDDDVVVDEERAARDLAAFVQDLRAVPVGTERPPAGRRPLRELDAQTREALRAARGLVDTDAALAAWDRALAAPAWTGAPGWIHGDLLRPNVLVREGRVCAVIDFGGAGVGDPATDVIAAWAVLGPAGRSAYRAALDVDDGAWERARGIALHQAALIVPYYRRTNPAFTELARRTIDQVLGDVAG